MLSANKEKAIAALLAYPTKRAAAEAAGITDRTLRNYFKDEEFQQRYRTEFLGLITEASQQAQQTMSPALSTLREIMVNNEENAQTRIYAARTTLEYAVKLTELADMVSRLEDMEKTMEDMQNERNG